jgi:Putative cyclase
VLPQAWDSKSEFPADSAQYYGGHKQADVKPTPDSPLQTLGIEKVPPIITTGVLLDAKSYLGHGSAMQPGQAVTAMDIEVMLKAQGLERRGLMPGDVLYIYTGCGDNWKDPDTEKFYYTKDPGLSYDAAEYIAEKQVVLLALDNPFTDPVADGFLQGKAPRQARPEACRLRSTTPISPSLVSTKSRTRTSERSPRTRCGCRARSSCRCARREMPVRRCGRSRLARPYSRRKGDGQMLSTIWR